jgi:hexosaminidase
MENIRSFANTSIEMKPDRSFGSKPDDKEIDGLLLTLWDDDSPHFELYMRGILAFAEYTWSGDERSKEEIKAAYRHREYGSALSGEEYGFVEQLEEAVAWWNDAFLKSNSRNKIPNMEDPLEEAVIDLPFSVDDEDWSARHSLRVQGAAMAVRNSIKVAAVIDTMKMQAVRNKYRLEVYEQVNNLVRFSGQILFALQTYDIAQAGLEKQEALAIIHQLMKEFPTLRAKMEEVYGRTRILNKPEGYKLDQDHHSHMANQSLNFDWQFWAEIYFLEKLETQINNLQ